MSQIVTNYGTAGTALNGVLGDTSTVSTNDPTFTDWDGSNHLRNYADGNLATCPVGAWGFTSDFQLDWFGSVDSFTRANTLFSKLLSTGDQRSWWWRSDASGNLVLTLWPSGTTAPSTSFTSSVAVTTVMSVNQDLWLRCTYDQDNGSSLSVVKFFTSPDGVTYTQLGTDRTAATVAHFNGTADLCLGGVAGSGSDVHSGRGYYWRYQNGIAGTTQFLFDTRTTVTQATQTSWTETSSNARTVSLFRSTTTGTKRSCVVTNPLWAFSTDDFMSFPDDPRLDIPTGTSFTVVVVGRRWNNIVDGGRWVTKQSSSTGAGWRIQNNSTNQQGIAVVYDTALTSDTSGTGNNVTNGELSVAAMIVNRSTNTLTVWENGLVSTGGDISTTGAIQDAVKMTVGQQGIAGAAYPDMELYSVSVFRRVLSTTELSQIRTYYQNRIP